jgi:hypothetical protein
LPRSLFAEGFAILKGRRPATAARGRSSFERFSADDAQATARTLNRDAFSGGVGVDRRPMAEFSADDWGFISGSI